MIPKYLGSHKGCQNRKNLCGTYLLEADGIIPQSLYML